MPIGVMIALRVEGDHIQLVKWDNHKTVDNQYRDVLVPGLICDKVAQIEGG